MLHLIGHLATFVRVAELGSFSAAGRSLAIANSSVSRQIQQLEVRLGAAVFVRTTRSVRLTAVGERLLERARRLLSDVDGLAIGLTDAAPSGRLRVAAPWRYGRMWIAPLMAGFSRRYPNIRVELISDDRIVDLVAQEFDVAIRLSRMKDSNLIARKLGDQRSRLVAAPSYLKAHPEIEDPHDVAGHAMLAFLYATPHHTWTFRKGGRVVRIPTRESVLQSNNADLLSRAAVDGVGLLVQPDWAIRAELDEGVLVPVLTDHDVTATSFDSSIYLAYPRELRSLPRVRAWVDYVVEAMEGPR
ncbi:MAG: LysR family transcriptional regulator [Myxococcota bacterium]